MSWPIRFFLEKATARVCQRRVADENHLSDLIQDALERYLSEGNHGTCTAGSRIRVVLRTPDAPRAGPCSNTTSWNFKP